MQVTINDNVVKIALVDELDDYLGLFNGDKKIIYLLNSQSDLRATLIHELTYAYLYYHGFTDAPLNADLVSNFMEIYGEKIINTVDMLLSQIEYN